MRWTWRLVSQMSPKEKTLLETAIKIGEEAVTQSIALETRLRRLRWHIYKARHQLAHGKAKEALDTLDDLLVMTRD
jgi:hypothetical protein